MVIGVTGKKNSGKDTVAKIIILILEDYTDEGIERFLHSKDPIEAVASDVEIRSFAEPIKRMVAELINKDIETLEDREFKEKELPTIFTSYKIEMIDDTQKLTQSLSKYETQQFLNTFQSKENLQELHIKINKFTPRKLMQLIGTEFGREMIHNDIWVDLLFENYNPAKRWIISDVRFENEAQKILKEGGYLLQIKSLQIKSEEGVKDTHASENRNLTNLCHKIIVNEKEKGFKPLIRDIRDFLKVTGIYEY